VSGTTKLVAVAIAASVVRTDTVRIAPPRPECPSCLGQQGPTRRSVGSTRCAGAPTVWADNTKFDATAAQWVSSAPKILV